MSNTLSRTVARKARLMAQAIGAAILLLALLIAFLIPGSPPVAPSPIEQTNLPTDPNQAETSDDFQFDPGGVMARLAMLDNAPRVKVEEPVTPEPPKPKDPGTTNPGTTPGIADRIRFLGTMRVGEKRLALISVDGRRQRVVSEGSKIEIDNEDVTLQQADDNRIYVVHDGATVSLPIQEGEEKPAYSLAATPTSSTPGRTSSPLDAIREAANSSTANQLGTDPSRRRGDTSQAETQDREGEDPIERRRQALQRAVENGTLSQERADEMMERAIQNQLRNSRRQPDN